MSKYLLSGGCGFIGSHLVDLLCREGNTVCVLDNLSSGQKDYLPKGVKLINGSITDPITWRKSLQDVDGVFHLAAIAAVAKSVEQWHATHVVNASGTIHLFAQAKGIPIVYASSAAVYGNPTTTPISETAPLNPLSPYAADKIANEYAAQVAWHLYQTPSVGCRFFNVYGPRQDPFSPYSGVISIFREKIFRGEPITFYGDGDQVRDFIYVGDVVHMLLQTMMQLDKDARIYNFCTGIGSSIREVARLLGKGLGKEIISEYAPAREGDIQNSVGDPTALQEALGLVAKTPLEEGLKCV